MKCPHCEVHIDEHEASRCLDAWVAGTSFLGPLGGPVYGFLCPDCEGTWFGTHEGNRICHGPPVACGWKGKPIDAPPSYSTDIATAWEVLQKILDNDPFSPVLYLHRDGGGQLKFYGDMHHILEQSGSGKTVPLAICRAAVKAFANVSSK